MTTSIRIHPDKLFALKTLAHHRRTRVNTLIDKAIDQYLELHSQPKEAA
jgi:predicted transcriptional regulator